MHCLAALGRLGFLPIVWAGVSACSSNDADDGSKSGPSGGSAGSGSWVAFIDPASEFSTRDVYDSNREVVHFDAEEMTMVWPEGVIVSGWTAHGNDLDWDENSVDFRVLFGVEQGAPRAYFTETLTGTICDLVLRGQDDLTIFATSEPPPGQ